MKWPKTSGARINIGSVRGGMSGNIEFKIYKDNDVLFTIKHDITEQDKCITLDGEGVHGYEVAQIPKGLLKNDETYFVSGIFTEPRANDKYSIWLCYVAPWID